MLNESRRQKRILIVDDEATLVFFLKQGFHESPISCQVEVVSSGEEAVTKLTYTPFDLLITDLKMPGISGFTLVEVARSLYPDIKVILMTAFSSKDVQDEAENLAVEGYLNKPFPTNRLIELAEDIFKADEQTDTVNKELSSLEMSNQKKF